MALTDIAIKNSKPRLKPHKIFDGYGMFLLVNPNGSRYWRLKFRFGGKEKLLALGVYPEIGLRAARERRDAARALLVDGKDPVAERKAQKRRTKVRAANTFETTAYEYIGKQAANRWTVRHAENWQRTFQVRIFPALGHRPIADIDAPELLSVLRKVEDCGAHDLARRLLQRCGLVFRYGVATGRCTRDPAADLRGSLTPHVSRRMPAIPIKEFPALLAKIDAYHGDPVTRLALQFLALTFVRVGELVGAHKDEIDLTNAKWLIPATRMKTRHEHVVPLAPQAIAVLQELNALNSNSHFLFPGRSNPAKHVSANTLLHALYLLGYRGRMSCHGFRTLASTVINEKTDFNPDAVERQLDHRERNAVRRAYNRAEYWAERVEMMQWWADHLDQLRGGNVIPARFGKTV